MTLQLVIEQRRRDLGGFEVGACCRLPSGAWSARLFSSIISGRRNLPRGIPRTVDVRPHPHIGLSTVTYLFEGEIMHRDSVGSEQAIQPGEVNWMVAGRGITHSERFEKARAEGGPMHGIQAWVALPREDEETTPTFANYAGDALPTSEERGVWMRLIAGECTRRASWSGNAFADVLCARTARRRCGDVAAEQVSRARRVCRVRSRRSGRA